MRDVERLQQEALQVCFQIYEICQQNGIRCWLGAGTLLGAIRHKGFIPWDDDIDLEIWRDDYGRFQKIVSDKLGEKLIVQNFKSDPCFPFPFTKVFKKNADTYGLHYPELNKCGHAFVDVFPLSKCPAGEKLSWLYFKTIEMLTISMLSKVCLEGDSICGYTKPYVLGTYHLLKKLPITLVQKMSFAITGVVNRVCKGTSVAYAGGKYGYPFEKYDGSWFLELEEAEFEGQEFAIPKGWDAILRHKYGDYRILPNEEEKKGHFEEFKGKS